MAGLIAAYHSVGFWTAKALAIWDRLMVDWYRAGGRLQSADVRMVVIWQYLDMKNRHRLDDYPHAEPCSIAREGKGSHLRGRCAMLGQCYSNAIAVVTKLTCLAWWKCSKCQCRERRA